MNLLLAKPSIRSSPYFLIFFSVIRKASPKNANSFLNEILSSSTFKFEILNPEEELQYLYSAVINSFSKPKGVICNIGDYSTELLMYNRRNVLHTMVIPFGAINIGRKFSDIDSPDLKCDEIKKFFVEELKQADWFEEITEEYEFIGTGAVFRNLGVLSFSSKNPLNCGFFVLYYLFYNYC